MKVIPIAADSLGVRSMACLVQTPDVKILIDPSAALAGERFGLKPSPQERIALKRAREKIKKAAKNVDIIIISHYHWDHFDPKARFYRGKKLFFKDPNKNINGTQRKRAADFFKSNRPVPRWVVKNHKIADGKTYEFGKTKISFSPALLHGEKKNRLGYVVMTTITRGKKKFIHTSDVAGPSEVKTKNFILKMKPDLVFLDGPPTLFLGWRYAYRNRDKAERNLLEIIKKCKCQVILDHHLVRDKKYLKNFSKAWRAGKVRTAAKYLSKKNSFLESQRAELWAKARKNK